ncbi:MAG: FKBP-type peptidyl-prolyl cis-trans isomerase [Acidobacteriota bacterium]|nr:FKBP-type peptidyl-prolyl cis-trans isomerase [Acidobacteriota bacterium]
MRRILLLAPLGLLFLTGPAVAQEDERETVTTKTGLQYVDLVVGDGPQARRGDNARVHYSGWFEDGSMFDSSRRRGQTFSFRIGRGQVIRGWDQGVVGMQIGGKRKLIVPSKLGYGKKGFNNVIPPNATLTFEIELVGLD